MIAPNTRFAPLHVEVLAQNGSPIAPGSPSRYNTVDGTLVFADISGFTALSERLAKKGRIGAELLNELLTISFSPMLDLVDGLGGDLISFGGDALCILFSGEQHVERAIAAAHGLRASLRRTASQRAPIDRGTLKVSMGVHSGPVLLALAGSRCPMLVTLGETLSRTLALESQAEGGQVFLSAETHARLISNNAKWADCEPVNDGVYELVGIARKSMPWLGSPTSNAELLNGDSSARLVSANQTSFATAVPGVDPNIAQELVAGRADLAFHQVTLAFIHYDGVDALLENSGPVAAVSAVHQLMSVIQDEAERVGLTIIGTDVDGDGGKVVLCAGVPNVRGLEHDRMLDAVRRILDAESSLAMKIGVHGGTVFAGLIGSDDRAVYTSIGDVMNTTARIMAKASHGTALVSPVVLAGARTPWSAEPIEPFAAKGKREPLRASVLGLPQARVKAAADTERLPFYGRVEELARIGSVIAGYADDRPALIELVGDGGLGKTRLMNETLWRLSGMPVIRINGSPFAKTQGYFALQSELRLAFGIDEVGDVDDAVRDMVRQLHPEIEPLLPLFGGAFGCDFEETPESRNVAEVFRVRRTNQLVAELLDRQLGQRGVVLVVDDSYWLDEATASLVAYLINDPDRHWFFLVARRPEPTNLDLSDQSSLVRIELDVLDDESAMAIAEEFAASYPLTDDVLRAAVARASGNPLLLELVLEALRSGASIQDLPEEAERLVASRFDSLPFQDRELLRAASVLGMDVSVELLAAVVGSTPSDTVAQVELIADFLVQDSLGAYRFRHALIREAAYEGLAFAKRRRLHQAVVESIESGVPHVGETISLLAIHAVAAAMHDRIWKYAREAAETARLRGLLSQGAGLLRASIDASKHVPDASNDDLRLLWENLGDVELVAGQPIAARTAFTRALTITEQSEAKQIDVPRLLWKRSESRVAVQQYKGAVNELDQLLERIASATDDVSVRLRAEALRSKGVVLYRRGKYPQAIRLLNEAWAEAEAVDDNAIRARISYVLGLVETSLGSRHASFYVNEAVALLRSSGFRVDLGKALCNIGYFEHVNGRWDLALKHYEEGARVSDSCGDIVTAANSRNNIGEILSDKGEFENAEKRFLAARRSYQSAQFAIGIALITSNLGRLESRRGNFSAASPLLSDAASAFSTLGVTDFHEEALGRVSEMHYFRGEPLDAIRIAEPLLKTVQSTAQNPALESMLLRVIGASRMAIGEFSEGRTALLRGLSVAKAFRCRPEQLAILALLVLAGEASSTYEAMTNELCSQLGVSEMSPIRQTGPGISLMIDTTEDQLTPKLCDK